MYFKRVLLLYEISKHLLVSRRRNDAYNDNQDYSEDCSARLLAIYEETHTVLTLDIHSIKDLPTKTCVNIFQALMGN